MTITTWPTSEVADRLDGRSVVIVTGSKAEAASLTVDAAHVVTDGSLDGAGL